MKISTEEFRQLLLLACAWAEEQEAHILKQGVGLTPDQVADAKLIGVAALAQVRLLSVDQIPVPEHPALPAAAEATHLISPLTALEGVKSRLVRPEVFPKSDRARGHGQHSACPASPAKRSGKGR